MNPLKTRRCIGICAPLGATAIVTASAAHANQPNATDLPSYPGATNGIMDATYRDTFGHSCIHYMANSAEPLATVEAWYRKQMAGAHETPVNADNMYGGFFKLDGSRLKRGNDFANTYRSQCQKDTSVELFSCRN
ncbi:MAG: hypothetical protein JSS21_05215 [Proteobacteria bacterium]|nr:hypothetical protein [Pseudomonadota bacterium]